MFDFKKYLNICQSAIKLQNYLISFQDEKFVFINYKYLLKVSNMTEEIQIYMLIFNFMNSCIWSQVYHVTHDKSTGCHLF